MHADSATSILDASVYTTKVQTIDGFNQDNVSASQTNVELARAAGRYKAARAGNVINVLAQLESGQARTGGSLTVRVYIASVNPTTGARTETATDLIVTIDDSNPVWDSMESSDPSSMNLAVSDEVYAKVTTTSGWTPTTADLRVSIGIAI